MKDSKCRFIEEYANFQIKQHKKTQHYSIMTKIVTPF